MNQGQSLLIYGAGGHGWVVADAAQSSGWRIAGLIDDTQPPGQVGSWARLTADALNETPPDTLIIIAIGDNARRRQLQAMARSRGLSPANIIHPSAIVSTHATLGCGIYIGPHAIVNAQAQLEDGVIVNSGAIVEHHCRIGAYAHIAPNAALGGEVTVGEETLVGLGASVKPRMTIGSACTIGVGAVVVKNVPDGCTVIGAGIR